MNRQEKVLYHQIHPLKLVTDSSAGAVSYSLLWHHRLRAALVMQLLPAIAMSLALIRWADLEPYKESSLGRYIERHMTRRMEAIRLLGNLVISVAAWYRRPRLMVVGFLIVLFGWLRGRLPS